MARMLALGYPGGPIIDQLAHCMDNSEGGPFRRTQNERQSLRFQLQRNQDSVALSLRAHIPNSQPEIDSAPRSALPRGPRMPTRFCQLSSAATLDLIASFQRAVVDDLATRTLAAAEHLSARTVLVSGGVAANSRTAYGFRIRSRKRRGIEVYFPSRALSTDNAAMIAAAGHPRFLNHDFADATLNAEPNLALA